MIFLESAVSFLSCAIEFLPKTMLTGLQKVKLFIRDAPFTKILYLSERGYYGLCPAPEINSENAMNRITAGSQQYR